VTHPITPPPELVKQWTAEFYGTVVAPGEATTDIAARAAQWGANQELEACCEYLVRCAQWEPEDVAELRAARRPRPPSLKARALEAARLELNPEGRNGSLIIQALEALPE
jgi:hypothetical protein